MEKDYISYLRSLVGNAKVIMVVAGAIIFDNSNRILLQKRADNGCWGFPGGYMEMGETVEETAKRECLEEVGLVLGKLELFSVNSGENYEVSYSNGDEVALVQVMFTCHEYSGEITESSESLEAKFFDISDIPSNILPTQIEVIEDLKLRQFN